MVIDRFTGTASATPVVRIPAGTVPVARLLLQPTVTAITNDAITDEHSLYSLGSSGSVSPGTGGGLLNVQVFSTPGTYTYTPTAGRTKIIVEVQGLVGSSRVGGLCVICSSRWRTPRVCHSAL